MYWQPEVERRLFAHGVIGYGVTVAPHFLFNPSVWCYRIGSTLIDTGFHHARAALLPAIMADGPIEHIFLTHHHEDHIGNAAALKRVAEANLVTTRYTAPMLSQGFTLKLYQEQWFGQAELTDADEVLDLPWRGNIAWKTGDGEFEIHHVPGHAHDHTIVYWPEAKTLFSADLYIADRIPRMRADESWAETVESTRRVCAELVFDQLLCAHNPMGSQGYEALCRRLDYLEADGTTVQRQLKDGQSPHDIAVEYLANNDHILARFFAEDVSAVNYVRSVQGGFTPREDVLERVGNWARYQSDR